MLSKLPYQLDSLSSWIAFFDEQFEVFLADQKQQSKLSIYTSEIFTLQHMMRTYYQDLLSFSPKEKDLFLLYKLHAAITVFINMVEFLKGLAYYHSQSLHAYLDEVVEEIVDIVFQIKPKQEITSEENNILIESSDRLHEMLFLSKQYATEQLFIFRLVWNEVLPYSHLMEKYEHQIARLLHIEKEKHQRLELNFYDEILIAYAHFKVMYGDDKEAIRRLIDITPEQVSLCGLWVTSLARAEKWTRLEQWLDFCMDKLAAFLTQSGNEQKKREFTRFFLQYYEQYSFANDGSYHNYAVRLKQLLPYSYLELSEYLFEIEDFFSWTELQLMIGIPLEHMKKQDIAIIEARCKEALLPYYHHAVNVAINKKNRQGYREATKHLRKIRSLYRKLKKLDRWEQFIQTLAEKHKRLRAFQEELRKGKGPLLHD